jgi:hypothetical protein
MTEPRTPAPPTEPGGRPSWLARVFSKENLLAVALCLILIFIIILTSDNAPRWIYQGF